VTVRVGVIGTGIMGADHVNTLHRQVTGAAVTMVADLDLDRAREVAAALPDVRATDDGFALIGDPTIDAVVVASADATHADLTVAAIQAGKPVLCGSRWRRRCRSACGWSRRSGTWSGAAGLHWSRWGSCAASTRATWS
jgi:predicted homoserine dehydrogenase-like protein